MYSDNSITNVYIFFYFAYILVATMTVANVKEVSSLLLNFSIKEYLSDDVPSSRADVIKRGYPDPEHQDHAFACYYVECFPNPTWERHACRLYIREEMAALDKLYTFSQRHQKGINTLNIKYLE